MRGKVLQVGGEASDMPVSFQERVRLDVRAASGTSLVSWEAALPSLSGQRIDLAYEGATPDDQAILDSYGGVFQTPPYLVDLKPVLEVGGVTHASGTAIGSAEDLEIFVTLTPVGGTPDVLIHAGFAGEPSVLVTDFGRLPAPFLERYQSALLAAEAAGDETEAERARLQLIGATYLHNLGRDLDDLAGWNWHRMVKILTEGLIAQTGTVTTTVGGEPLTFTRAETFVDVAGMTLGLFHTEGDASFVKPTLELAGAQGSFLEGEVFSQVVERDGIAAVSALTRAQRGGQILTLVDESNVDAVLAGNDLGEEIEAQIRSAIAAGRIAWVPEGEIAVNRWLGTGYVLEDPETGAAAYLISGGYAGGADTGEGLEQLQDLLGSELWLESSPMGRLLRLLIGLLGGGDGGDDGPGTNQSDPINMSTGNMWFTETDLTIQARGLPVVWSRTYNSRSNRTGPLGHGWSFSYGEALDEQPDGSVLYRETDGTEHVFAADSAGGYVAPAGKHLDLTKDAGGFSLRTKNGLVSTFSLTGRLETMSEPDGNTVTLGYDGSGDLASVTDAAGRQVLTVTTVGGKIVQLTDLSGRTVEYSYTGDDLTGVTDTVRQPWVYAYDHEHNLMAKTNPLGVTDTYAYDGLDRCWRHTDPLGHEEVFTYTARGERAVLTDQRGHDTYFELDVRGRAVVQVDPLGNASRSTWDDDNNRVSTTDPRGGVTTRIFDGNGNLLSETDPLLQTTSYTYDPVYNQAATITYASGHTLTNLYDDAGNLREMSQVVDGEVITQSYTYDGFGQLETQTDANGKTTTFAWNDVKGSLESQIDPLMQLTRMETDDLGRVSAIIDPALNRMEVDWDAKDRVETATGPFLNSSIGYDPAGRQTTVTTPRGTTTRAYDAAGRLVSTTDPLGNTTATEYDPAGNPTARIDAKGNRTTTAYDAIGRAAVVVDALDNVWSYGYCAEIGGGGGAGGCSGGSCTGAPVGGDFCDLTDPLDNTTTQHFDALGRVQKVIDPLGYETTIGYDDLGRRTSMTDAKNRTTLYELDEPGRLTAVVETNGARTEYRYDGNGNVVNTRDAELRDWPRTYDELNRLETESDPLGNTTRYVYDALGNLERKVKPDDQEITYTYDVRRLTAVNLPGGAVESFSYDALGRRRSMANAEVSVSYVYDELNRLTETTNETLGQAIRYEHDENGNVVRMVGPHGPIEYFYDGLNRLVEQRDPVSGTYRYEYDATGRRAKLVYPNGLETEYTYDAASRLESIITRNVQSAILDGYSYEYDEVGNRRGMNTLHDGLRHVYQYDPVDRLTRWEQGTERFKEYGYDEVGNRETLTDENGVTDYGYDLANRLLSEVREGVATSYGWDESGNLESKTVGAAVTSYGWDALDRMLSVDGPTGSHSYGYDPNGIRFRETNGGVSKRFLLTQDALGFTDILGAYDAAGELETYYTHGIGIDEPLAQMSASGTHYLHRDGLGSVTAVSSPDGGLSGSSRYLPFGGVDRSTGVGGRYGYTSRELDRTGLMYYRARYYEAALGVFLSRDRRALSTDQPRANHPYSYVQQNPVNFIDPSGLTTLGAVLIPLGFVYLSLSGVFWQLSVLALDAREDDLAVMLASWSVSYGMLGLIFLFGGTALAFEFFADPRIALFALQMLGRSAGFLWGILVPCLGAVAAVLFAIRLKDRDVLGPIEPFIVGIIATMICISTFSLPVI